MHEMSKLFADYCRQNFDLSEQNGYSYQSLSVCLIDCIYSLRAKYFATTLPIIDRYASLYMNGNRHQPGDTISMLVERIEKQGGPKAFADNVLKNHQVLGGKASIPKEEVCYQLAKYLSYLHIDTLEDFQRFEAPELLESVIRSVKGIGDAGVNYLFMLAGDPNRCKPDIHIHRCVIEACGHPLSNDECQLLFEETVKILSREFSSLTVRGLDGIIWYAFSRRINS